MTKYWKETWYLLPNTTNWKVKAWNKRFRKQKAVTHSDHSITKSYTLTDVDGTWHKKDWRTALQRTRSAKAKRVNVLCWEFLKKCKKNIHKLMWNRSVVVKEIIQTAFAVLICIIKWTEEWRNEAISGLNSLEKINIFMFRFILLTILETKK